MIIARLLTVASSVTKRVKGIIENLQYPYVHTIFKKTVGKGKKIALGDGIAITISIIVYVFVVQTAWQAQREALEGLVFQ